MRDEYFNEIIIKCGFELSNHQFDQIHRYVSILKKWGRKINLTALLNDDRRLYEELIIDALFVTRAININGAQQNRALDIGSGNGAPAILIAIIYPNLRIVMTDSQLKKVHFIKNVIRELGLKSTEALQHRFDEKDPCVIEGELFDWVTSKAVADPQKLGLWSYSQLKNRGELICMKGGATVEEKAPRGFEKKEMIEYTLPLSKINRKIEIFKKSGE